MPFFRHVNEIMCICRLYKLFREYHERSIEKEGFDRLPLCCFDAPYDKFNSVRDVADW